MSLKILALSSSRVGNGGYLESAVAPIQQFLGNSPMNIAFIPFAAANNDYEAYVQKVRDGLQTLRHNIDVVTPANAKDIISHADVIMVGGGNTFKLLHDVYEHDVFTFIRQKVQNGTPYIGWSAGANITGLTIGTTNDMPIIEPKSFTAFGFLPFQLNPHYYNVKPEGFNGETRDDRLSEYLMVNSSSIIVGLPEGTSLLLENNQLQMTGDTEAFIFKKENATGEVVKTSIPVHADLSYLLHQ
jgi:dipeptidase E